jgi:hypothetical protein
MSCRYTWAMRGHFKGLPEICLAFALSGCSGGQSSSLSGMTDHPSFITDSILGILNSLGNETETLNFPTVAAGDCSRLNYSYCTVGTGSSVVKSMWNACTFLNALGNSTLLGGWNLEFSSPTDCNNFFVAIPTSGSIIKKSPKDITTGYGARLERADTTVLVTNTDAHQNYKGTSITGGMTTVFGSSNQTRTVQIAGVHRQFYDNKSKLIFDHSVVTNWPHVSLSGTRPAIASATTTRVANGSMTVSHNILLTTAEVSLNAVTWGSYTCTFPTSGVISMTFTDAVVGTASLTITGCGTGTFLSPSGDVSTVSLTFND